MSDDALVVDPNIYAAILYGAASGACRRAWRKTLRPEWLRHAAKMSAMARGLMHQDVCLRGSGSPAKNIAGETDFPSALARMSNARWWRAGISPPVPPRSLGYVHRKTHDRSMSSHVDTTPTPPQRSMMSDAGFMRWICDYRTHDVNGRFDHYAGGDEAPHMNRLPTEPDAFRRALASEMSKDGRSQSALAERLGVHQSAISRMISGDRRVKVEEIAIIAKYLEDTGSQESYSIRISGMSGRSDDIGQFSDILDIVKSTIDRYADSLAHDLPKVDNDYELLLRICATLSVAVQVCIVATARANQDEELLKLSKVVWRNDLGKKLSALKRVGRLSPMESDRLASIFAIRDAFLHSPVRLSLTDPRLRVRLQAIIIQPVLADAEPALVRALLALSAAVLLMRLGESDPKVASEALRDLADELSE